MAPMSEPLFSTEVRALLLKAGCEAVPITEEDVGARAKNALRRRGILVVGGLLDMTVEQLLDIRNIGRRSIDQMRQAPANWIRVSPFDSQVRGEPPSTAPAMVASQRPQVGAFQGQLFDTLDEPGTGAPLDRALARWVAQAAPKWSESRRRALMTRIGWNGSDVCTLEAAAGQLDVTRERVRQMQLQLTQRLRHRLPLEAEPFQRAAQLVSEGRDAGAVSMGTLLWQEGLLGSPLPDAGIALMFDLLGTPEVARRYEVERQRLLPEVRCVVAAARRLANSVGVVCLEWVQGDAGVAVDLDLVRSTLESTTWVKWLDSEWFWYPRHKSGRNRLENVTIKMLAACGPLELHEISDGLDRYRRVGRLPRVPSSYALRLFFADDPKFSLSAGDIVSPTEDLDADLVLDETERTLYHILRDAPMGFLDRTELLRQATEAGINQNTFAVYSSYSPILDNPVTDRWVLRGADVSPAAMEAYQKQRKHRLSREEWTEAGSLRLEREVADHWSLVVSIPHAYRAYLNGRTFQAVDMQGATCGLIRWASTGLSWGYSVFLQALDAKDGDVLVADFDLIRGSVTLYLRRVAERLSDGKR